MSMTLETTQVIDGNVVFDTGEKLMGHRIFNTKDDNGYDMFLYIVDSKGRVKATISASADCGQNVGYISDWEVKNF